MDEAVGRKVAPAPWRGPTSPVPPDWSQPAGHRRGRTLVGLLLVFGLIVGGNVAVDHFRGVAGAPGRDGPPPGYEESAAPLGTPPPVPALPEGSGYRFMAHAEGNGDPVTWSPCRPIHYVVREANQPAQGALLLERAIGTTSAATGLRFVKDGTTTEGPSAERPGYQPERYGDRWAPVLVAWATPDEVADFAGGIAGEAGPMRVTSASGARAYVSGTVYLDPAKFSRALTEQGADLASALVLHELGHLVGLAHVRDPEAIMFPQLNPAVTGYSLGDRVGLAALGGGSCQPQL